MFQKFGRYILLEKIAKGGMAEIWLAKQTGARGFEKIVVIKKILPQFNENENFSKMFINEAKIAAKLTHPNIVQIYDLGKENKSLYIAMEYIPGYDLLTVVKKSIVAKNRLPLPYAVKIISASASALYYANNLRDVDTQKLNIVHRDISPQNILVSNDGITKVVDFGIAKAASNDQMTKTGVLKGKYPYMSPEQILGKKLDGRSDIFSLAIVLYEITVGKRLFKSSSELRTLKKITEERIIPPIEIYPTYPKKLNDIIMKALKRNRQNRYNSAKEFAYALDNYLIESNKNISTIDISNWLKKIFKEDIVKRILENKRLFNEADLHREKENVIQNKLNNFDFNSNKDKNINEFEFDKKLNTNSLELSFNTSKKKESLSPNKDIPNKSLNSKTIINDHKPDNLPKKRNHNLKKIIIAFFSIAFIYLLFFTALISYNIFSTNKELEKGISDASMLELSGKELNNRVELVCNEDYVLCDKESIRVLELPKKINLSIKYKINRNLFGLVPISIDFDKNLSRKLNR